MSDWYSRQFGDREEFALAISLGRHPHPRSGEDRGWGGLSLWVGGRCLTRSISEQGGCAEEIRWELGEIATWLTQGAVRLLNEEPFPLRPISGDFAHGCDWFVASETAPLNLQDDEEQRWFEARSDWRQHHALRRAAVDVALPNVVLRRLDDQLEVSWDNERWGTTRPDLSFVERRGSRHVSACSAAAVLHEALLELDKHLEVPELTRAVADLRVRPSDWRWLVHRESAALIRRELPTLARRLARRTQAHKRGLYVPHTRETQVLRQARPTNRVELESLLSAASEVGEQPMSDVFRRELDPSHASTHEPWLEGYERALELRDSLGWDEAQRTPDLSRWLSRQGARARRRKLPASVDLVSVRDDAEHLGVVVNAKTRPSVRSEMVWATALGHLLMDPAPVSVGGRWEHWPNGARARAFAVMLSLPDAGVRQHLGHARRVDADAVRSLMAHYATGPHATTFHLRNRGFIEEDERITLLTQLTR